MATEYYDLSKEQKASITRAKRAMQNLQKNGLCVVMVDGTASIYSTEDRNNAGTIDCGKGGIEDENGILIDDLGTLENIEH